VLPDGAQVTVAQLGGGPNGAAIGPDGAAYICNDGGFQFLRLDQALNAVMGRGNWPPQADDKTKEMAAEAAAAILVTSGQPPDYTGGSIQRVDLKSGAFSTLYTGFVTCGRSPLAVDTGTLKSPDDLVFDSAGGFWFTDWGKQRGRVRDITGVYYALPDGSSITETIFPANCPNGIALSPDEKRLYVAETYSQRVLYFDLAAPGVISPNANSMNGGHVLAAGFPGALDSMAVDEQGNLYVATLMANGMGPLNSGITIVSPAGEILEFMTIDAGQPDPLPSNICFGGPDRRTAYITMGGTGALVTCRMEIPGYPLAFN
jgi:gluconolactonase